LIGVHHELDRSKGAPGSTVRLADELTKAGCDIKLAFFDHVFGDRLGARTRQLLFPSLLALHVQKLARTWRPDIVDVTTGDGWLMSAMRRLRHRGPHPVIITRSHGLEHAVYSVAVDEAAASGRRVPLRGRLYHGGFRLWEVEHSVRWAQHTIVTSTMDKDYITTKWRVDPARVSVIPELIDNVFFESPAATQPRRPSRVRLVFVGTWIERKGTRFLVQALEALGQAGLLERVTLVGTGVPDERVRADLSESLSRVTEVIPVIANSEVPEMLDRHDAFVLPTLAEGAPLSVIEAMARGVVVVATPAGGIADIIDDELSGILVPYKNSDAIIRAVRRLTNEPGLLDRLSRAARRRAQHYRPEILARHTIESYQVALAADADGQPVRANPH
jgi:glycosyltransferase involved in cell wall biosynthesis